MKLPDYYEFCCRVKVVAGHQVLERLPRMLAQLNACKPMIITDKGVMAAGLADIVLNALDDSVSRGPVDDDVPPDSDLHTVHRLARIYRDAGCDAIIAVGGGSVIDTAKGVNMAVSENVTSLLELAGAGALKRELKPLIVIPTTAGTGSEVTLVAVISDLENQVKLPFVSYFLQPDIAILDSRMTLSLPPAITAATGMDALCHAVEAYTCLAKNPLSDAYSLSAIELISRNIERVILHPGDKQARLAMANAACLAGIAFSNSMVGMVHTLGHATGAVCHVPHGVCMAILLPYGLEYNMHKISDLTAQLLLPLAGSEICAMTPKHLQAQAVIDSIRSLNHKLYDATDGSHPRAFKEVRDSQGRSPVRRSQLEAIAAKALNDGSIFYNPEELDYDDCLIVMKAAYEGTPLDIRK
jgi:alcohol dehydrogenase